MRRYEWIGGKWVVSAVLRERKSRKELAIIVVVVLRFDFMFRI